MRLHRAACCFALLACGLPAGLHAQGFTLNDVGTCAVGRGYAVTAAPCKDPSLIYWNPGAATTLPGWSIYAGVAAIDVTGDFTADTTGRVDKGDVPVSWPPHLFVNYTPKSGKWAVGVGAYIPYGLTSQWKSDFPGRFEAQKASLASFYIQPNVAFRIAPGWSIGGGPVFGHSTVELRQSLDLARQFAAPGVTFGMLGFPAGTEFARARLKGSANAWGFNVGLQGQITPDWQLGVRYLSQLDFKYDNADATFTQVPTNLILASGNPLGLPAGTPLDAVLAGEFQTGGPLTAQTVSTRIRHPAQLAAGLAYTGFTNTTLDADFIWMKYDVFDQLPVNFQGAAAASSVTLIEDYQNSWAVRFGAEHGFANGIKGRAGFSWAKTPAPDATVTPLLPDMNRRNYNLGVGFPLSPTYSVDLGYLFVSTSGRRGRIVERTSESQTAAQLNSGFYRLHANVFSLSLRAFF